MVLLQNGMVVAYFVAFVAHGGCMHENRGDVHEESMVHAECAQTCAWLGVNERHFPPGLDGRRNNWKRIRY